ncbi:MAG: hypothetical protein H6Q74_3093 [Firmicutes bacterium]|nr:hypothetical protein [Bacillota bacterium]
MMKIFIFSNVVVIMTANAEVSAENPGTVNPWVFKCSPRRRRKFPYSVCSNMLKAGKSEGHLTVFCLAAIKGPGPAAGGLPPCSGCWPRLSSSPTVPYRPAFASGLRPGSRGRP